MSQTRPPVPPESRGERAAESTRSERDEPAQSGRVNGQPRVEHDDAPESGTTPGRTGRGRREGGVAGMVGAMAAGAATAVSIIIFGAAVVWATPRRLVVVEAVQLPGSLAGTVGSGEAVAQLLRQRIFGIMHCPPRKCHGPAGKQPVMADMENVPDIELPATQVSARTVVGLARRVFGYVPSRVNGVIRGGPDRQRLTVSVDGLSVYDETTVAGRMDTVLQAAAEAVVRHTEPEFLGAYYALQRRDTAAERVAEHMLRTPPETDGAVAYNLLGSVLQQRRQFDEALRFYRKAVEFDPRFYPARVNLGSLLNEVWPERRREALAQLDTAIALAPRAAAARAVWAEVAAHIAGPDSSSVRSRRCPSGDVRRCAATEFSTVLRAWARAAGHRADAGSSGAVRSPVCAWGDLAACALREFRNALRLDREDADTYFRLAVVLERYHTDSLPARHDEDSVLAQLNAYEEAIIRTSRNEGFVGYGALAHAMADSVNGVWAKRGAGWLRAYIAQEDSTPSVFVRVVLGQVLFDRFGAESSGTAARYYCDALRVAPRDPNSSYDIEREARFGAVKSLRRFGYHAAARSEAEELGKILRRHASGDASRADDSGYADSTRKLDSAARAECPTIRPLPAGQGCPWFLARYPVVGDVTRRPRRLGCPGGQRR